MLKTTIGRSIRKRRRELNMSYRALAQKIGRHKSAIVKMEKGEALTPDNLERLAKALKCELIFELRPKEK